MREAGFTAIEILKEKPYLEKGNTNNQEITERQLA
jgi:hypothetical protein